MGNQGEGTIVKGISTQRRSRPRHRWPVCSATGKERLRERKDVIKALGAARIARRLAEERLGACSWTVVRGYRCTACGGWHLTSLPEWNDRSAAA